MTKQTLSPAAVLKSLFVKYDLNPTKLAGALGLNQSATRQLTLGKSKISVPFALRLAKFFGTTSEYWLDLQRNHDLLEASKDKKLAKILKGIQKVAKPAAVKKTVKTAASKTAKKPAAKKTVKLAKKATAKPAARAPEKLAVQKKSAAKKPAGGLKLTAFVPEKRGRPAKVLEAPKAAAEPEKRGRPAKVLEVPKAAAESAKRGRKPKVKVAALPVQENVFVPHVELIKKKDIGASVPQPETATADLSVSLPESEPSNS